MTIIYKIKQNITLFPVHNHCMKLKKNKKIVENANEVLIKQQNARIAELKEEVKKLESALTIYREKEKDIIATLDFARKKGEEYLNTIRVKYALECERVSSMRKKLEKFRSKEALIESYDNAYSELKKWQIDMENTISADLGAPMSDYLSERKRLDDEPSLNYDAIISSDDYSNMDKISEEDLIDLLNQL